MPHSKPVELTDGQLYALTTLSEQRGANIIQLADLVGDMNADGLEFLRRLGDPRHEALTNFLSRAKAETLTFLAEDRPEEIDNLQAGLRIVVSIQLIGRILKWSVVGFLMFFAAAATFGEKVSTWLKVR